MNTNWLSVAALSATLLFIIGAGGRDPVTDRQPATDRVEVSRTVAQPTPAPSVTPVPQQQQQRRQPQPVELALALAQQVVMLMLLFSIGVVSLAVTYATTYLFKLTVSDILVEAKYLKVMRLFCGFAVVSAGVIGYLYGGVVAGAIAAAIGAAVAPLLHDVMDKVRR